MVNHSIRSWVKEIARRRLVELVKIGRDPSKIFRDRVIDHIGRYVEAASVWLQMKIAAKAPVVQPAAHRRGMGWPRRAGT
ncbi:hypothetical protein [Sinomonas sp. G460-2]|uniref:hypothetical protein n=1 Tax=Sinomonas sp. G460-2 TaxID=3393464 RepID=UPI0039F0DA80